MHSQLVPLVYGEILNVWLNTIKYIFLTEYKKYHNLDKSLLNFFKDDEIANGIPNSVPEQSIRIQIVNMKSSCGIFSRDSPFISQFNIIMGYSWTVRVWNVPRQSKAGCINGDTT